MLRRQTTAMLAVLLASSIGCSPAGQPNHNSTDSSSQAKATDSANRPAPEPSTAPAQNLAIASPTGDKAQWKQVSPGFSLLGKVARGIDSSNSKPDQPKYQYIVEVDVKNTGSSPLTYDTAELTLIPATEAPLRAVQKWYEGHSTTLFNVDEFNGQPEKPRDGGSEARTKVRKLNSGKEEKLKFEFGGYTDTLIARSPGKPIICQVTLSLKGRAIAGPFRAELPDINSLPSNNQGAPPQAVYMSFK